MPPEVIDLCDSDDETASPASSAPCAENGQPRPAAGGGASSNAPGLFSNFLGGARSGIAGVIGSVSARLAGSLSSGVAGAPAEAHGNGRASRDQEGSDSEIEIMESPSPPRASARRPALPPAPAEGGPSRVDNDVVTISDSEGEEDPELQSSIFASFASYSSGGSSQRRATGSGGPASSVNSDNLSSQASSSLASSAPRVDHAPATSPSSSQPAGSKSASGLQEQQHDSTLKFLQEVAARKTANGGAGGHGGGGGRGDLEQSSGGAQGNRRASAAKQTALHGDHRAAGAPAYSSVVGGAPSRAAPRREAGEPARAAPSSAVPPAPPSAPPRSASVVVRRTRAKGRGGIDRGEREAVGPEFSAAVRDAVEVRAPGCCVRAV